MRTVSSGLAVRMSLSESAVWMRHSSVRIAFPPSSSFPSSPVEVTTIPEVTRPEVTRPEVIESGRTNHLIVRSIYMHTRAWAIYISTRLLEVTMMITTTTTTLIITTTTTRSCDYDGDDDIGN